jgi:hypothetical protein
MLQLSLTSSLQTISCSSATACTASDGARAYTFDGTNWSVSEPAGLGLPLGSAVSLSCAAADTCTIASGFEVATSRHV